MSFTSDELLSLYESHAPVVFGRAMRFVGSEAEAWDVVHDTFLTLMEQGRRFRQETRPVSYLVGIATHLCLRRLRSGRIETRVFSRLAEPGSDEEAKPSGEAQTVARNLLKHLLEKVGENERILLVAVYKHVDGMTQEQIAEAMGLSRKTIQRDLDTLSRLAATLVAEGA